MVSVFPTSSSLMTLSFLERLIKIRFLQGKGCLRISMKFQVKSNDSKDMLYFSPNTSIEMRDEFEQEMNIMSTQDLVSYLGFPLCHMKPSNLLLSLNLYNHKPSSCYKI